MAGKDYFATAAKRRYTFERRKNKELEAKIADMKGRWPKHSVRPHMFLELEELENEVERLKQKTEREQERS